MKKMLKNNLFFKFVSVIFALIIWIIIVNISDPTESRIIKNIKIRPINDTIIRSKGKVFSFNNDLISVEVKGRKTVVGNLSSEDFIAVADMSKVSITNTVEVNIKLKDIKKDVLILDSTKLENVKIDNIVENPFPVTIVPIGDPEQGYAVGSIESNPTNVVVRGGESVLKKIKEIKGEIDVNRANSDTEKRVSINAYDGDDNMISRLSISLSTDKVDAKVFINRVKKVPVIVTNLPNLTKNMAYGDIVTNPETVNITGNKDVLSKVNNIQIPFSSLGVSDPLDKNILKTINIKNFIPKDIKLVNNLDKVSIKIPVGPIFKKSFEIDPDKVEIVYKARGYKYKIKDSRINVEFNGLRSTLDRIVDINDLKPYIRVDKLSEGENKVKLEFTTNASLTYHDTYIYVYVTKE